jgi:hypothetical protein
MQRNLNEQQMEFLRKNNLVEINETAYCVGDLIVAENPLTKETRVIGQTTILQEGNRRILKG